MRRAALFFTLLLLLTACQAPAGAPEAPGEAPAAGQRSETPDTLLPPDPEPLPAPDPEPAEPVVEPADTDFVRVADYIPGILIDLRYAGENNFTGGAIYEFSDAYLRYGTVKKLRTVQAALEEQGYGLLLWDAFRPVSAQFVLWEVCPDGDYVSDPNRGFSSHSRGNTVDATLVTAAGEPVEMPTDFDDFTPLAHRDCGGVPESAAAHARLLEEALEAAGFCPYRKEWWHFSDSDGYDVEETFSPCP